MIKKNDSTTLSDFDDVDALNTPPTRGDGDRHHQSHEGHHDDGHDLSVKEMLAEKAAAELDTDTGLERFKFEQYVVGGLGFAALALCMYNIFVRFFFPNLILEWGDEVQVYIAVWAVFLVLGVVTATGRHIKADLFVGMFSVTNQHRLHVFGDVLGLAFSAMLVYLGILITWQSYDYGDLSITSLRFPMWIYIAALPVGFALSAIHYFIRLIDQFRNRGQA